MRLPSLCLVVLAALPAGALGQAAARLNWVVGAHVNAISETAFSPSGALAASTSSDGTLKIWRVADGELLTTFVTSGSFTGFGSPVRFTPDEQGVLALSGSAVALWRLSDGELIRTFPAIFTSAFDVSPDGQYVVVGEQPAYAGDPKTTIFRLATGQVLHERTGLNAATVAFAPDSQSVYVADANGVLHQVSVATGQDLNSAATGAVAVESLDVSPDGTLLAVADMSGVTLYTTHDLALRNHVSATVGARRVTFAADNARLLTGNDDGRACVLDLLGGQLLSVEAHGWVTLGAAWSPDGTRILTGGGDASVRLWNAATGEQIAPFTRRTGWSDTAAISADGTLLAVFEGAGDVSLWNQQTGAFISQFSTDLPYIYNAAMSPTGDRIALSTGDDNIVRIYALPGGALLRSIGGHNRWIGALAFSPDGQTLATTSAADPIVWQGFLRLHRVSDGALLRTINASSNLNMIRFSPDGSVVASGGSSVSAWTAQTGQFLRFFHGHQWSLTDFAFAPDGQRLVTSGYDLNIKLWDFNTGTALTTLPNDMTAVYAVNFSADGRTVAAAGSDIRLWNVATYAPLAVYTREAATGASTVLATSDSQRFIALRRDGTILSIDNPTAGPKGDMNCDDAVDFFDIDPFVMALFDPAAYAATQPGCDVSNADLDENNQVNFFDIDPFLAALFGA
jgi:WD40 repeat protein